ncbi:MAG: prolyl-tRNA synthetase [Nitrospira bacterium SG8_35_4]|nr:MAG: prolyl-tRNA synthetase [Nitrospira bacterium SG8_35_4]
MPVKKLKDFLERNNIKYNTVMHSPVFTAQEVAASAHIPGNELAKTVVIKVDGRMAMAVVPAPCKVDFERLKHAAGARSIELAGEEEFEHMFPECDIGAMPPFGNLYDMEVFEDERLTNDAEIAFSAGSHSEVIKLARADFEKLVHPKKAQFSC